MYSSSIIAKITDAPKSIGSRAIVYFFFDGRDAQTGQQTHDGLLRSLIARLSDQSKGIPPPLRELYANGDRRPSIVALENTLGKILDGFEKAYIIVDALDECTDREGVLKWITRITSQKPGNVHLVVTSRPERDIRDAFEELRACCVDVARDSSNHDIVAYLDRELETDRKLKKWCNNRQVREEIRSALMKGAQGMYVLSQALTAEVHAHLPVQGSGGLRYNFWS